MNCIKSQPLSTWLLNIQCDETGSLHKAFLQYSREKHCALWAEWATPSMKHQFYLKECLTDQSMFIQTWILSDIFSKMNEISLSLQGKQLMLLVANHKIWAFKQKLEVWKTCIHHCGLEHLSTFRDLSDEIGGGSDKCDFNKTTTWIM